MLGLGTSLAGSLGCQEPTEAIVEISTDADCSAVTGTGINAGLLGTVEKPDLDTTTSHEVMQILQGLGDQGITVVLVTHEHDIAAHARRVITLRDGLIVDDKSQEPIRAGDGAAGASTREGSAA